MVLAAPLVVLTSLLALPLAAQSPNAQSVGNQSLGDVARQQRGDAPRTHASRVLTNDDLQQPATAPEESSAPAAPPTGANAAKPNAQPAKTPAVRTSQTAAGGGGLVTNEERASRQKHAAELTRNMQSLQAEINDLEKQRTDLRAGNLYGDPNRSQKNEEIRQLGTQIDAKRNELSSVRAELQEMNERAARTSVLQ
jgi:hypothetical protein